MPASALALVMLSAVAHVYWNYQVKRSPEPALYTWWIMALGAVLFAPAALCIASPAAIPPGGWACVGATGLLYAGYFLLIARSYGREDLSRAYPIARGVAPLATAALGVAFHREHPTLTGWTGIFAISLGVTALALPHDGRLFALPAAGVAAAIGTGLCTSGYSAVDKHGVQLIPPPLYIVLTFAVGALAQWVALRRPWLHYLTEARRGRGGLVLAAAASLGGYLLVLEVLRTQPVSYVVPVRSVAVLLSVVAGVRFLGEEVGARRWAAAAVVVLGIIAIAVGG